MASLQKEQGVSIKKATIRVVAEPLDDPEDLLGAETLEGKGSAIGAGVAEQFGNALVGGWESRLLALFRREPANENSRVHVFWECRGGTLIASDDRDEHSDANALARVLPHGGAHADEPQGIAIQMEQPIRKLPDATFIAPSRFEPLPHLFEGLTFVLIDGHSFPPLIPDWDEFRDTNKDFARCLEIMGFSAWVK